MANTQILRNTKIEMQSGLGADVTVTGITNANPAVITANNTYSNGELVVLSGIVGMPEMNDRVVRVSAVSGTEFTAEGVNSSSWGTYVSGGVANEVTPFVVFDNVTNLSLPDNAPEELTATTVHDSQVVTEFGMEGSSSGTFQTLADPLSTTSVEIGAARDANTRRVFRVTLQSGYVGIFNAFVAGGRGIDGAAGQFATGTVSLTMRNAPQWFVS